MKVGAIVLLAGNSSRFSSETPKQMYPLNGKPVFVYSLEAFSRCHQVDDICLVTSKELFSFINEYVVKNNFVNVSVIEGGKTRQESVRAGLNKFMSYSDNDFVIAHDAARPLIDSKLIYSLIEELKVNKAITTYIDEPDTLASKTEDGFINNFVDRTNMVKIQTPQAFELGLLRKAHFSAKTNTFTDDASLVLSLGEKVKLVKGSEKLLKITTKDDIQIIERLLK